MADIQELGRRVKQKYPGQYDDLDDAELGRRVKQKFPGAYDDFTDVAPARPAQQPGMLETFRKNIGIAAEQGYVALKDKAAALGEIVGSAAGGDFRPALEAGESIVRGAAPIVAALGGRPELAGQTFLSGQVAQARPIAAIEERQSARRLAGGDTSFQQREQRQAELEAQAEGFDPSLSGRITRGVVREGIKLAPTVLAGVASGGSVPAIAATTALSSLDEPANLVTSTALSTVPVPSLKAIKSAVGPVVERVLGRGAAQIVEAEAAQTARQAATAAAPVLQAEAAPTLRAGAPSISAQIRATGPSVEEAAMRASGPSASLNAAISAAAAQVPEATWRRAVGELSAFPRAMMSSLDISAPGRQGLLLSVAPSRWGAAVKAGRRMFRAFKPQHYDKITKEIANHADAGAADDAGLYLAFKTPEEFFTSRLAAKVPGVSASQRAYETYLDSLRMSTFSQYRRLIDKSGLSPDDATKAYKAAAQWINYATGRGSLGKNFDKAVPLLSQFLFAPRFAASRFNIVNPLMYARNFADPATRIVAKAQMRDLAQYLGAVATTFGLAASAGLDVGLNPNKGDFLKIRWGGKLYDPGAGLIQVMRFAIRASNDLFRASKGEKAERGQDAGSLALKFIRSKLAPVPSYAWDFFSRRTYEGKDFTPGQAALGVIERTTPLTWSDFTEALLTEGVGGAAATLPGAVGIGVQSYTEPGGFLDTAAPLLREYTRAKRQLPEIRKAKDESAEQFNARLKVFGEALQQYGVGLVESEEYRSADESTKDKALDLLPRRIGSALMRQGEAWQLAPRVLVFDAKDSLQQQQREPRRLYNVQGERLR